MTKPFAEACERNREPILDYLKEQLAESREVLEIGSGTGQHAVYFSAGMPHLDWHASDLRENLPGIRLWLEEAALPNLKGPLELDVCKDTWPELEVDAVFSANTAHIMSWQGVVSMLQGIGRLLPQGGRFALYGPFNYGGRYTSASNAQFDRWLRTRDPQSGIRDFEELEHQAGIAGLTLLSDHGLPANNRLLCWEKIHEVDLQGISSGARLADQAGSL